MSVNNLDDIAAKLPQRMINKSRKTSVPYYQKMQSSRGKRTFYLITVYLTLQGTRITLAETTGDQWRVIGNRSVSPTPESMQNAIKSLEKKAGCKLYYILLIDTDGNYL